MMNGPNIDLAANEPEWSNEELLAIQKACSTVLMVISMADTRRSVPDPERRYLEINAEGMAIIKPQAMLPRINWCEFSLGLGTPKADGNKLCSDVVMKGPNWVLTQWTSTHVVIEGVAENILEKPARMINSRSERRLGHDFARIGLPKISFGPIFETLQESMPTILESVTITKGYYWLNASWAETGIANKFVIPSSSTGGAPASSSCRPSEAMKMLAGMSSMGIGTITISLAAESRMEGGKIVPSTGKYELSIKIHHMFHAKKVNYRSPPQSSANQFQLLVDTMVGADGLDTSLNVGGALVSTFESKVEPLNTNLTHEAISEGSKIPLYYWKKVIDLSYWDKYLDGQVLDIAQDPNGTELTTYFAQRTMEYLVLSLKRELLLQSIFRDFQGWNGEHFQKVHRFFFKAMVVLVDSAGVHLNSGDSFTESFAHLAAPLHEISEPAQELQQKRISNADPELRFP